MSLTDPAIAYFKRHCSAEGQGSKKQPYDQLPDLLSCYWPVCQSCNEHSVLETVATTASWKLLLANSQCRSLLMQCFPHIDFTVCSPTQFSIFYFYVLSIQENDAIHDVVTYAQSVLIVCQMVKKDGETSQMLSRKLTLKSCSALAGMLLIITT